MKIKKIGILKEEHIKGEGMLETLKTLGILAYCSDLARLTDVEYDSANGFGAYWFDGKISITKKNKTFTNYMNYITKSGTPTSTYRTEYRSGVRIAISFDDIEDFDLHELENLNIEYPLTIIGGRIGETINNLFEHKSKLVMTTGRKYNINGKEYCEYEAFGLKFIKMQSKAQSKVLSDGTIINADTDVYLKCESIPLIIDEQARLVYSTIVLFGAPLDKSSRCFKESDLNQYLNNEFLKSINDELEHDEPAIVFDSKEKASNNRYNFNFTPLTEEDIIEICINSNIAVFVHGKTGVGKTERLLALDKNLELVDFGCTSADGFTGIIAKDFNSKELFLYQPYWYKSLCKKCEAEPDKIHILFLEELTNAKNDIQKVAFEVTLNKTLTNSGFRLKLPKNAVVCAAGNEASDSKSANTMSEPLFGRFAHVYIDTDSQSWLKWALRRKKEGKQLIYRSYQEPDRIHPAIVDYIRVHGDKVLRTKYDGYHPNADPRKWALASKALYQCNNPNVLRAFIGEELTQDFIKFCNMNLITVEDVLNDRCSINEIPFDPSLRWCITICLSIVDDENVDKVREFVSKLGKEFLAVFDYEWSKDNEQRIMKLYNQTDNSFTRRLVPNGNR